MKKENGIFRASKSEWTDELMRDCERHGMDPWKFVSDIAFLEAITAADR